MEEYMEKITIQSRITKEDYRKATMFGAFGKTPMMKFLMFIAVPVGLLQFAQAIYSGMIAYPLTFYSSIVMFGLIAIMYFVINWDINRFIKTDRVLLYNVRTIYIEENGITHKCYMEQK